MSIPPQPSDKTAVSDMPVRVLVCGGRDYADVRRVAEVLDQYRIDQMCQGGATGADRLAWQYADARDIQCDTYHAAWSEPCTPQCFHAPRTRNGRAYCPVAGLRRNQRMLDDFRPDLVVAFPGGSGTAHMVRIAQAAGVHVVTVGA